MSMEHRRKEREELFDLWSKPTKKTPKSGKAEDVVNAYINLLSENNFSMKNAYHKQTDAGYWFALVLVGANWDKIEQAVKMHQKFRREFRNSWPNCDIKSLDSDRQELLDAGYSPLMGEIKS